MDYLFFLIRTVYYMTQIRICPNYLFIENEFFKEDKIESKSCRWSDMMVAIIVLPG